MSYHEADLVVHEAALKFFDQLALDVANRKVTQAGAFRLAYLKGFERGYELCDDEATDLLRRSE